MDVDKGWNNFQNNFISHVTMALGTFYGFSPWNRLGRFYRSQRAHLPWEGQHNTNSNACVCTPILTYKYLYTQVMHSLHTCLHIKKYWHITSCMHFNYQCALPNNNAQHKTDTIRLKKCTKNPQIWISETTAP